MGKFFVYEPDSNKFELFDTEDEARSHALAALDYWRDRYGDGWSEMADGICWGRVMQRANERIFTDKWNPDIQYSGYEMEDAE